ADALGAAQGAIGPNMHVNWSAEKVNGYAFACDASTQFDAVVGNEPQDGLQIPAARHPRTHKREGDGHLMELGPEPPTVTGCPCAEIWKNCITRNEQTYLQLIPTRPR